MPYGDIAMLSLRSEVDLPAPVIGLSFHDRFLEADQLRSATEIGEDFALRRSPDGVVAEGRVRIGPYMSVPAVLGERGIDPVPVLAEFGLTPGHFLDPENTIAFRIAGRLFARCAEVAGCPHFALLVGQRASFSSLGAVGFLMESAPDVRTALRDMSRHFRVHNPNAAITVFEEESFAVFGYAILQPGLEAHAHILDFAMAIGLNIMQAMCGQDWSPVEMRFAHARPRDLGPYRFFRSVLRFDEGETALVFARHWMDRRPHGADRLLHMMMAHRVGEIEAHSSEDLVDSVRRILPAMVLEHTTTLAVVAKRLGLGVRTLNRRLAAEGTSFMQLREEASRAMARQLLDSTRMPVTEIAGVLGYANPGAFTRAFGRWAGVPPTRWRISNLRRRLKRNDAQAAPRRRQAQLQQKAPVAGGGSAKNSGAGKPVVKKRAARRKGAA
jgi:AraC-like DNA-binding protein